MSDDAGRQGRCEAFEGELSELALGILPGRSRSAVLAHVASCPHCSGELERLSAAADGLLSLAPEAEPPVGFELRFAERLSESQRAPRVARRQRHLMAGVAAAVVALLVGFGVGFAVHHSPAAAPPSEARLLAVRLVLGQHDRGEAIISAGKSPWLWMTLDGVTTSRRVTCEVSLPGGRTVVLGRFNLSGGHGTWSARLPAEAAGPRSVTVLGADGKEVAWGLVKPLKVRPATTGR